MAHHSEHIGYFVIREQDGTAELEIADTEAFEEPEQAQEWIRTQGEPGVGYWVCATTHWKPLKRTAY